MPAPAPQKVAPWATAATHAHITPPDVQDDEAFPSLGGGAGGPKFAGRNAPPPSIAPAPPTNWQASAGISKSDKTLLQYHFEGFLHLWEILS